MPEATAVICNYSVTPESLKAAARMVYGKLDSQGQWMLKHYVQPLKSTAESSYEIKGGVTADGDNEIDQVVF